MTISLVYFIQQMNMASPLALSFLAQILQQRLNRSCLIYAVSSGHVIEDKDSRTNSLNLTPSVVC